MNENEKYVASSVRNWVLSGFYTKEEIQNMVHEILEEDCDEEVLLNYLSEEFKNKELEEKSWPKVTDYDRLHQAFYELHEVGICALHNAGYTMSEGHSDVAEVVAAAPENHYHGYCFYHGQDIERAIAGSGLSIAFGNLEDHDAAGVKIGDVLVNKLNVLGFKTEWDGSTNTRINIPNIRWQKRFEPSKSLKNRSLMHTGQFLSRSFMALLRKVFP